MGRPDFQGAYPPEWPAVSLRVKVEADFRCVRCMHPGAIFIPKARDIEGAQAALRQRLGPTTGRMDRVEGGVWIRSGRLPCDAECRGHEDDGRLRVLTVHHLDNDKANLAWWNLAALCQVCHLQIQAKVAMDATYLHPHSEWFVPYVAGYYAKAVLGEDLSREEVESQLPELLAAGQPHLADHYMEMAHG